MDDSFDVLVSRVAECHHGVFGSQHLRALEISEHERTYRVISGRWALVYKGVYRMAGTPLTWHGEVLAACWAGGARGAASHRTAAELWDLPGRTTQFVEITCPRWRRARHEGLVVHESLAGIEDDRVVIEGIPTTTVARTLLDLAAVVGSRTMDLAIENALRRKLTDITELRKLLDRMARRGRNGTTNFRRALDAHDTGRALTESEAELLVLRLLEAHGLPAPSTQHEIRDPDGRLVARVDFAYPDVKIAIEYDSFEHHTGRDAIVRDGARRNAMVALGWLPITATARDLANEGHQLAASLRQARALRFGVERGE